MDQDDKIIVLDRHRPGAGKAEDPVLEAVMRLKDEPIKQVNWPAVKTWMIVGFLSMASGILIPSNAGLGLKIVGAVAMLVSVICVAIALLYREAQVFWVVRKVGSRHRR